MNAFRRVGLVMRSDKLAILEDRQYLDLAIPHHDRGLLQQRIPADPDR